MTISIKELSKIGELLGEENEKKLKDAITDILIDRFESDLEDMSCYMIDYEELFDEIRKEVMSVMKEKVMKSYMEKAEKNFSKLFNE